MRKFLAFAAVAEVGVALAMLIAPALVVRWLLGVGVSAAGNLLGRFFGIALLALEVACWPAVGFHAVAALLLCWTWRGERRIEATPS